MRAFLFSASDNTQLKRIGMTIYKWNDIKGDFTDGLVLGYGATMSMRAKRKTTHATRGIHIRQPIDRN